MLDGDELREVFGAAASSTQNHGREVASRSPCNTLACAK